MTSQLWRWSDIVDPQSVTAAMAEEAQRAIRKRLPAANPTADRNDLHPVAA